MPSLIHRLWRWLATATAAVVILLAILVGVFRVLLTQVPDYQNQIEEWASELTGLPISVGQIDARWKLGGPALYFTDARISSLDGSRVLFSAEEGSVVISLAELIVSQRLKMRRFELAGLELEVERTADGQIRLADPGFGEGVPIELALGSLPESTIVLTHTQIAFRDHQSEAALWSFKDVELTFSREKDHIDWRGSVSLPVELGRRLRFSGWADGRIERPEDVVWGWAVRGQSLRLAGWSGLLPVVPSRPVGGLGDLDIEARLHGNELEDLRVDVDFADLQIVARPGTRPRAYEKISSRIAVERQTDGWRLSGTISELTRAERSWPVSDFNVVLSSQRGGTVRKLDVDASFVRIEDLHPLVPWLPSGELAIELEAMRPIGDVRDLFFRYSQRRNRSPEYTIRAQFEGLGFEPRGKVPGLAGLNGRLSSSDTAGRLQFGSEELEFAAPNLFRDTLQADSLKGIVIWRNTPRGLRVLSDSIEATNPHVSAHTSLELTIPVQGSPVLDLRTVFAVGDLSVTSRYLPAGIMPTGVVTWLDAAIAGGRSPSGEFVFSGPMERFPFSDGSGEFRVTFDVEDLELAYAEGWPAFEQVAGEVEFRRASMTATADTARFRGFEAGKTTVSFADLTSGELVIQGSGQGPLADLQAYLLATPLADRLGQRFGMLSPEGIGELDLDIFLPIRNLDERRVETYLYLREASLGVHGLATRVEDIGGAVMISDRGVFAEGINANMLGSPIQVRIETGEQPDDGSVIEASGRIDFAEAFRRVGVPLDSRFRGEADVEATVRVTSATEPFGFDIRSSLEGLAIDLPTPVGKPAEESRPLELRFVSSGADLLELSADYGANLHGAFEFESVDSGWRFRRGVSTFGQSSPSAPRQDGLALEGQLAVLDLSEWLILGRELAHKTGGMTRVLDELKVAELDADELRFAGFGFDKATLRVRRQPSEWWVHTVGPQLQGSFLIPFDLDARPITASMDRLLLDRRLGVTDGDSIETLDPRGLPGVQLQAEEFSLLGLGFGAVTAQVEPDPDGVRVTQFNSSAPSFVSEGAASWMAGADGEHSTLQMKLTSTDLGPTLAQLGYLEGIEGKHGNVQLDVYWLGPPDSRFLETLSGTVSVRFEKGRLTELKPGAGKVFGLLSLSALPRRLSLDFRDVFKKGLTFDEIDGDFVLTNGDAYTSNLLLKGPTMEIGVAGRAGLAARDYDQTAAVSGDVGLTLPVAGAVVGGPAVGAALFVFTQIFEKPLRGITRVYYRIQGSWEDPQIEKVVAADIEQSPAPQAPAEATGLESQSPEPAATESEQGSVEAKREQDPASG